MSLSDTLKQIASLQALNRVIQQQERDRDSLHLDVEQQQSVIGELSRRTEEGKQRKLANQKAADALELKIREHEGTNAKLDTQLNVTKHQVEYDRIRQSIVSREADIAKWEDEELELLEQTDELRRQEATLSKELEAAGQELHRIEQAVGERTAACEERLSQLRQQSEALRTQIDPNALKAYRRISGGRGESALATVRDRVCQGCFTMITKQTENELMRDAEMVYCHSCSRILMLGDEDAGIPQ